MGREYLLDEERIEWTELIKRAKEIDEDFGNQFYQSTSQAAQILRDHGHEVSDVWPIRAER